MQIMGDSIIDVTFRERDREVRNFHIIVLYKSYSTSVIMLIYMNHKQSTYVTVFIGSFVNLCPIY